MQSFSGVLLKNSEKLDFAFPDQPVEIRFMAKIQYSFLKIEELLVVLL